MSSYMHIRSKGSNPFIELDTIERKQHAEKDGRGVPTFRITNINYKMHSESKNKYELNFEREFIAVGEFIVLVSPLDPALNCIGAKKTINIRKKPKKRFVKYICLQ